MTIFLIVVAVVIVGAPLAAVVLVSFASIREESLHTVAGLAPGSVERAARRLLAFHADGICKPTSLAQSRGRRAARHVAAVTRKPMAPVP